MKELRFSKQAILTAIIAGVVIALGILAIQFLPLHPESDPSAPQQEDALASDAAVFALEAFFHLDYEQGKENWINRICTVSTLSGCQLISAGADPLWINYQEAKVKVTASVTPVEKLAETATEQIWKMAITLSNPLPGSNKTQDTAYVAIVKTDSRWKFDRFLLEPEIEVLLTRRLLTVTPVQ